MADGLKQAGTLDGLADRLRPRAKLAELRRISADCPREPQGDMLLMPWV